MSAGSGLRPPNGQDREKHYRSLPASKRILLQPGERGATREALIFSTLLGSCVAACLYDPVSSVAGMNHFLLANQRYARSIPLNLTEAGRYGIHAMELLITDMQKLGAARARLRAKVFGGASISAPSSGDNFWCVGEVNARFIREYLSVEGIPIDSEDLGGSAGRVIHFHSDSFQVFRRFIKTEGVRDIERQEHEYWRKGLVKPASEGEAVFF